MYYLKGFVFVTLIGIATSFPYFVMPLPRGSPCDATIVSNSYGATLRDCPDLMSLMYGSDAPTIETVVTDPATVKDMNINWFLNDDSDPSLIVTLEVNPKASAQEYTMNVMSDSSVAPIYCGTISTPKPELNESHAQTISIRVTCDRDTLAPSKGVVAITEVKVQNGSLPQVKKRYRLPSCENDPMMYHSAQCIDERDRRINFEVEQNGNSVDVLLRPQTAYRYGSKALYVMIAERIEKATFIPWKTIGRERLLTFPERSTTFGDLKLGATYQVTVWRPDNPAVRYENIITLKYDQKIKGSENFMRRLRGNKR